jgi:hypothetical protein
LADGGHYRSSLGSGGVPRSLTSAVTTSLIPYLVSPDASSTPANHVSPVLDARGRRILRIAMR